MSITSMSQRLGQVARVLGQRARATSSLVRRRATAVTGWRGMRIPLPAGLQRQRVPARHDDSEPFAFLDPAEERDFFEDFE